METSLIDSEQEVRAAPRAAPGHPRSPGTEGELGRRGAARRALIGRRDSTFRRSLALADMAAVTLAFCFSAVFLGEDSLTWAVLAVPPVFVLVVKAMGLYDRDEHLLHRTTLEEVPALLGIATLGALLLWLSGDALIQGDLGRRQILGTWLVLFVLLIGFRSVARAIATRATPVERCLFVGDPVAAAELRRQLELSPAVRAELVGVVPANGAPNGAPAHPKLPPELGPILDSQAVDRVILGTGPSGTDELLYIIRELKTYGVKVSVLPEASRVAGSSVELDHLHGMTLLGVRRFEFVRSSRLIKRGFDILGSALALTLVSPLLIASAIAIKLDSRGPVLFRQLRVGRHGDRFEMLKFRSMVVGAEERKEDLRDRNEGASGLFKIAEDPRATRVGRLLRRHQLDELPQLINVLRGDMSLVGPRPLIPEEDEQIEGWYRRRLDVPPGMTGHWQILGSSSRISLDEMVKLDYLYVANWSLWGDVQLLLRTVPFVARRRGV